MVQPVTHRLARRRRARGFAMIAMVTMVALISSYLLANVLTRTSTEIRIEGDVRTRQALNEAKAVLIAYAASQAWRSNDPAEPYKDQPGNLPCPDTNNDGSADSCGASSGRLGRFPWKTIGASNIRDGSGELLWYALSAEFRNAPGSTVINSDTEGSLTLSGTSPATKIVAVIIAPGPPTGKIDTSANTSALSPVCQPYANQLRSSTNSNVAGEYLELQNAAGSDAFINAAPGANKCYNAFVTAFNSLSQSSEFFNDQIVTITQAELMAVVEPAVAAKIESSIKPYLTAFATEWSGAYPFPVSFSNTGSAQSSYVGSTSNQFGLLPISDSATYSWTSTTQSASLISGTAGSLSGFSCSTNLGNRRCSFTINPLNLGSNPANWGPCTDSGGTSYRYCIVSPVLRVRVSLGTNAGLTLSQIPDATEVTSNRTPISSASLAGSLTSTGAGVLTYQATYGYVRYSSSSFTRSIRFDVPPVISSAGTGTDDTNAGWFIKQQWYRQTYFAVASGFLPGGGTSCTAGTNCLTVSNLPSSYATANDKRAILVFMGRSLNGSTRPSSTLANYMEGVNATADNLFQHFSTSTTTISGVSTQTNDRVIVVAP